jgi:hypothetical protein
MAGTTLLAVAVLASQGISYRGYVSEAGVAGHPYWIEYRLGIFSLAVGLVLLAGAMRSRHRPAAVVLLMSGLLAGGSGSISCSEGCPLPPFETPTVQDLVHGGTSIVGVGLSALAILVLAVFGPEGDLRRVSRVAVAPIALTGLVNAYALIFIGRSELTGAAERLLLILIVAWCVAAAAALIRSAVQPRVQR